MNATYKYKNQWIHVNNESVSVQYFYKDFNYKIYKVKSFRAAQLLITKLNKEQ